MDKGSGCNKELGDAALSGCTPEVELRDVKGKYTTAKAQQRFQAVFL
jgi:hypothetical protein